MKKVSRKTYDLLLHSGSSALNEAEFSIKEFSKIKDFTDQMKYLRKLAKDGTIKYIEEGSSRMAYLMKDGKCLKVARTNGSLMDYYRGLEQNRVEVKNSTLSQKYDCFPKIFDYDHDKYTCLLTECCTETKPQDWLTLYKLPLADIMATFGLYLGYGHREPMTIEQICNKLRMIAKTAASDQEVQDWLDDYYNVEGFNSHRIWNCIDFLEDMKKSNEPKHQALRNVLEFWDDNGPLAMSIDDLCLTSNWGLKNSNGHDVPVIIDSGMDHDVLMNYYDGNDGFDSQS